MFDDLVESTATKKKTNKSWPVILSVWFRLLFWHPDPDPLIYTEALPKAMLSTCSSHRLRLHPAAPPAPVKVSSSRWLA